MQRTKIDLDVEESIKQLTRMHDILNTLLTQGCDRRLWDNYRNMDLSVTGTMAVLSKLAKQK